MIAIGVNLPWFGGAYGHDLGRNQAYPDWPVWYDGARVHDLLAFLGTFGIRLVRIWLFEEGEGLISDPHMQVDGLFLRNLEDLAGRLRAAGMQVYWTLFDANCARRERDRITARILTAPDAAGEFIEQVLSTVAPVIRDTAWAIDLCNEPEAIVAGRSGNGTRSGWSWFELRPSLRALRDGAARLLPGVRVSIGSGYNNGRSIFNGVYSRLKLDLDFYDYHLYTPVGRDLAHPKGPGRYVLGEIGCLVREQDRNSEEAWTTAQASLARNLDQLEGLGYEAAFLWYLNAPERADATALVYRHQIGAALRALAV